MGMNLVKISASLFLFYTFFAFGSIPVPLCATRKKCPAYVIAQGAYLMKSFNP